MNTEIALSVLKEFNKWRRGDDTIKMPTTYGIGKAIDVAIEVMEQQFPDLTKEAEKEAERIADSLLSYEFSDYNTCNKWHYNQERLLTIKAIKKGIKWHSEQLKTK